MRGEWKAMPKRSAPKSPSARNKPKAKAKKAIKRAGSMMSNRKRMRRGGY